MRKFLLAFSTLILPTALFVLLKAISPPSLTLKFFSLPVLVGGFSGLLLLWFLRRTPGAHWGAAALGAWVWWAQASESPISWIDFSHVYAQATYLRMGRGPEIYRIPTFNVEFIRFPEDVLSEMKNYPLDFSTVPTYHPAIGILAIPLSLLPYPWAAQGWMFLCFLPWVLFFWLLYRRHGPRVLWLAPLLALSQPVIHALEMGNVSAGLAGALGLALLTGGWLSGALLGLTFLFKPIFWLFPLVYLRRRDWKALGGMVLVIALAFLLALAFGGTSLLAEYMSFLRRMSYPTHGYNLSLWAGLARLGLPTQPWTALFGVGVVALGVWRWARRGSLTSLLAASLLSLPILFMHYAAALFPVLIVDESLERWKKWAVGLLGSNYASKPLSLAFGKTWLTMAPSLQIALILGLFM